MQTFLPYPDFAQSAACLDRQRLGKQRVEVLQLLKALLVPGSGWANHPAAKMWRGFETALALYGVTCCEVWHARGYKDTACMKIAAMMDERHQRGWFYLLTPMYRPKVLRPPWVGDETFHASHRSNLLRKDPVYYGRFGWSEPPTLSYVWPIAEGVS